MVRPMSRLAEGRAVRAVGTWAAEFCLLRMPAVACSAGMVSERARAAADTRVRTRRARRSRERKSAPSQDQKSNRRSVQDPGLSVATDLVSSPLCVLGGPLPSDVVISEARLMDSISEGASGTGGGAGCITLTSVPKTAVTRSEASLSENRCSKIDCWDSDFASSGTTCPRKLVVATFPSRAPATESARAKTDAISAALYSPRIIERRRIAAAASDNSRSMPVELTDSVASGSGGGVCALTAVKTKFDRSSRRDDFATPRYLEWS